MDKGITRRTFFATATVLGASLALAGCNKSGTSSSQKAGGAATAQETDIVVIGSGLAGSACARSAAENGARVILMDKANNLGSTFLTSGGNVSICQIPENEVFWQFEDGDVDSLDAALERYKKATEVGKINANWPDYDRVKTMMEESCESITWAEGIGIDFQKSFTKDMVGTDTVKPDISAEPKGKMAGAVYMQKMEQVLGELGVTTMLSTEAKSLIIEDGTVVGVTVDSDGKTIDIKAASVVLATGGFGASPEYRDKLVPAINKIGFIYKGNLNNTGDGMTMAQAAGAAIYSDCWVIPNVIIPCSELNDVNPAFSTLCDQSMFGGFIEGASPSTKLMVDGKGKRFINEASAPIALASTFADRDAAPYYVLFDSSNKEVIALLDAHVDSKNLFKAASIDELASAAGLPSLSETFAAYQVACAAGSDAEFKKPAEKLVAYQEGNLYLVRYVPSYVATMGGVRTDAECHAIDESGKAVAGLYVIGEATHRFMYNRSFVRHYSNGSAITMGRLVGKALA